MRDRSQAYPAIDLEAALAILVRDLDGLGATPIDRETLARRLGYSNSRSGLAGRRIAALGHYGWVQGRAGQFRLTVAGRRMQLAEAGTATYREALETALQEPPLFRGLLRNFRAEGSLPANLRVVLTQEYRITEAASDDVAELFVRSVRFAGLLREDGRLVAEPLPVVPRLASTGASRAQVAAFAEAAGLLCRELYLAGRKTGYLLLPENYEESDAELLERGLEYLKASLPKNLSSRHNVASLK